MTMAVMDWQIVPYVSVGPLRFGMIPEQVLTVLGPPETSMTTEQMFVHQFMRDKFPDRLRETRGLLSGGRKEPTLSYYRGQLVGIEFFPEQTELRWGDIYLFRNTRSKVIKELNASGASIVGDNRTLFSFVCGLTFTSPRYANENPTIYVFSQSEFTEERNYYALK